jgi:hypothetical protein
MTPSKPSPKPADLRTNLSQVGTTCRRAPVTQFMTRISVVRCIVTRPL